MVFKECIEQKNIFGIFVEIGKSLADFKDKNTF